MGCGRQEKGDTTSPSKLRGYQDSGKKLELSGQFP